MWHSSFLGIRTTPSLQSWQSKASHRLNSVTTPRRQSNFSMSSASISYIFLRCCFLVSREVVVLNRLFSEYISFSIHHRFLFRFFCFSLLHTKQSVCTRALRDMFSHIMRLSNAQQYAEGTACIDYLANHIRHRPAVYPTLYLLAAATCRKECS